MRGRGAGWSSRSFLSTVTLWHRQMAFAGRLGGLDGSTSTDLPRDAGDVLGQPAQAALDVHLGAEQLGMDNVNHVRRCRRKLRREPFVSRGIALDVDDGVLAIPIRDAVVVPDRGAHHIKGNKTALRKFLDPV